MKKETKKINQQELITLLSTIEKPTFTNIVMETKVRMNKTNNPYFEKVIKRSKCNYSLGVNYESRVNNNEVKEGLEGNFETEKPKGKTHISKCLLVNDTDNSTYYVMLERFDEIKPTNEYIFEGNEIDKQLFESYMTKVYESQKQEQERKVMVITPKIENIKEISLNGIHYIID
jgi:hypothetical protein